MAQCPSCKFENMPQNQTCVRCGAILSGSDVPVGVDPPRAGKFEKVLKLAAVIRTTHRLTGVASDHLNRAWQKSASLFQFQVRSNELTIFGMFWKGILPGLPQWYAGRTPEDKIFFFGWLILGFLTLLTFGLPISNVLLGLTIAWHLASIIDIAIITCYEHAERFLLFFVMAISTFFILYVPVTALSWNYFGIQVVSADVGPLRNGDALLYTILRNTITPQVGNVVLYQAPYVEYQFRGQGEPVVYRLGGPMFDRVLALEGQTISWKDGTLTIDGESPPHQPFVPLVNPPPNTTFVVPSGQCYIVPGVAFRNLGMPREEQHWQAMGLVPYGSIYGVVWGARRSLFHFVDIHSTQPPNH